MDLSDCPIYAMLHVLHSNLYIPLGFILLLCSLDNCCWMVLVVLNAMFMLVSLNTLVTCLIKGLKNVNVVHFLCSFPCSCIFCCFLFALFNALFSTTLGVCSSLSVSDQVLHSYKTTSKFRVLYILIFRFFDRKLEDNDSTPNETKHSLISICPLVSRLLARSQYPEDPATGHLGIGFSWFPCV